jgi:hypothetical protein
VRVTLTADPAGIGFSVHHVTATLGTKTADAHAIAKNSLLRGSKNRVVVSQEVL